MLNQFDDVINKYRMHALIIIPALSLIVMLSFTVWQWQQDWQLIHFKPTSDFHIPAQSTTFNADLIPRAHLFGQAISQDLPVSNLEYHVTGIVHVANDESQSQAYIATAEQPAKIYHQGEKLPSGTLIHTITADAVILENDGTLEKLVLPRQMLSFKTLTKEE